ncbi:hypothetical protein FACS1894164_16880 [Spirochaetia bacterium]|nr:hypothetical protein FACS1894164_16880 [Spirochaetia bacterium]
MKKAVLITMLFMVGFGAFAQKLPTVAVATFDTMGDITPDEAQVVTELFIAELVSSGKVSIVDRVNFDKIIKEMQFQTSDWSDSRKTAQLGSMLNAGYVMRGQLMKMGNVIYWTATMIDVNTAQVLYSGREQLNDLGEVFGKLSIFCKQMLDKIPVHYSIGDRGPGGGFIFYANNGTFMEVSIMLGTYNWNQAKGIAENYRGGGYTDWRLPSKGELDMIYQNLRKRNLAGLGNDDYWSSSESDSNHAWLQRFSDGHQVNTGKDYTYGVRAVRAF